MSIVFITTEALFQQPGKHVELLRDAGFEVRYPATVPLLTEAAVLESLSEAVAVIAGSEPYTDHVLANMPKLRIISRNGVGYDRVDVAAATRHGVALTITPNSNHQAVAEHAMALLLTVTRSIVQNAVDTRTGQWRRRTMSIPLRGKTLGVVGLGRIGRSTALRAKAFGMRLLACETYPDQEFVKAHGIELVDLDTLLAQSDFVTLHAPMSPDTSQLINRQTLARMKRGSVLINTARGGLVNEADLLEALKSGHLAGAGLDVLDVEPPPVDHPLLSMDNVIVTPHISAFDYQAIEDMSLEAAQNIIDIFAGQWPTAGLINSDVKTVWKK